MNILTFIQSKPVLIGLHLGLAIVGIDAFLWLLGKLRGDGGSRKSMVMTALAGTVAFMGSWLAGGYYYVIYYGTLVKPVIKGGMAPWAHNIIMEAKEHIFLFIVPMAVTMLLLTRLGNEDLEKSGLRRSAMWLTGIIAFFGLMIGLMGYIISAAARWA